MANDTKLEAPAASAAPRVLDPAQAHDDAVQWLISWRLTGCERNLFTEAEWNDHLSEKWQSVTEDFKKNWPRDHTALVEAVRRGLRSPGDATPERAIECAALLTDIEYAQDRKWIAEALDIRVEDLDKFVEKRRPQQSDKDARSLAAAFPSIEPWPESVEGAMLLDELSQVFRRFAVFDGRRDADALAVWSLGTHCFHVFNIFPRIAITSPEAECGKTTVLALLNELTARPLMAANITPAVVFRVVEHFKVTLLIDELDTFIGRDDELVGLLNSGHKIDGSVLRCEKINDKQEVRRFATFGPLAFGMIGRPQRTLQSRSLSIRMLRKDPTEDVDDLDPQEKPAQAELFERLRRQMVRWAKDHERTIREQHPETRGLSNRARDNWRPLMKIAAVASGDWPKRMHEAAGVTVASPATDDSDPIRLLRDIRDIFHTRQGVDQIPSCVLIRDLCLQGESGWQHFRNGREPIDERDLGKLLSQFQIKSKNIGLKKEQLELFKLIVKNEKRVQMRGYERSQFTTMIGKFLAGDDAQEVEVS